jgi:peroxiredoxin
MKKYVITLAAVLMVISMTIIGCGKSEKEASTTETITVKQSTLQQSLDAKKAEFAKMVPEEMITLFEDGIDQITASGVLETALKEGKTAPDFELPNAFGEMINLSSLLKNGPVVLTWYRGGWCPYCNIQLNAYNEYLDAFKAENGQLVAISPEIPDSSFSTRETHNILFEVLSDANNEVARKYGIVYTLPETIVSAFDGMVDLTAYNNNNSNELPLAVTYVIGTDQKIHYSFIEADYKKRAEPSEILYVLKNLGQEFSDY